MFVSATGADGLEALRLPYRFGAQAAAGGGVPSIGQHTLAILHEASFDANEARAMLEAGVVAVK